MNQCKYWKKYNKYANAIWFSKNFWMIGEGEHTGSQTCSIMASGSSDQWRTDLDGKWLYWNPDKKEWIKAENDIKVRFAHSLPYNEQSEGGGF